MQHLYRVWCETWGQQEENGMDVYSFASYAAAEDYVRAKERYMADFKVAGDGHEVIVHVKTVGDTQESFSASYVVTGRVEPVYSASRIVP